MSQFGLQHLRTSLVCRKPFLDTRYAFRCPGRSSPSSTRTPINSWSSRQSKLRPMQHVPATAAAAAAAGSNGGGEERPVRLAVVGDVHGLWDADSEAALHSLDADVAIFVGDFGEEDCLLVQRIAAVRHPRKAVLLGNHDSWYSLTARGRQRLARKLAQAHAASATLPAALSANSSGSDSEGGSAAVTKQLELLGDSHVGYRSRPFPELGLAVVGARPFSKGGKQWSDVAGFYAARYGVASPSQSAARIVEAAGAAPPGACRVVVAHNGPTGLGGRAWDICGIDWVPGEGDHGDPDLQAALDQLNAQGSPIPLVLFGHMHDCLKGGGRRNMAAVDPTTGTVYVNCAVVPRIREFVVRAVAGEQEVGGELELQPGQGPGSPREDEDGNGAGEAKAGVEQQAQQCGAFGQKQAGVSSPSKHARMKGEGGGEHGADGGAGGANKRPRAAASGGSRSNSNAATSGAAGQQQQQQQQLRQQEGAQPSPSGPAQQAQQAGQAEQRVRGHHFVLVEVLPRQQLVLSARNVWVGVTPASSSSSSAVQGGRRCFRLHEETLVSLRQQPGSLGGTDEVLQPAAESAASRAGAGGAVYEVFEAHWGAWRTVACRQRRQGPEQTGPPLVEAGSL